MSKMGFEKCSKWILKVDFSQIWQVVSLENDINIFPSYLNSQHLEDFKNVSCVEVCVLLMARKLRCMQIIPALGNQ